MSSPEPNPTVSLECLHRHAKLAALGGDGLRLAVAESFQFDGLVGLGLLDGTDEVSGRVQAGAFVPGEDVAKAQVEPLRLGVGHNLGDDQARTVGKDLFGLPSGQTRLREQSDPIRWLWGNLISKRSEPRVEHSCIGSLGLPSDSGLAKELAGLVGIDRVELTCQVQHLGPQPSPQRQAQCQVEATDSFLRVGRHAA